MGTEAQILMARPKRPGHRHACTGLKARQFPGSHAGSAHEGYTAPQQSHSTLLIDNRNPMHAAAWPPLTNTR